jgi:UDPglucose--hexose-1-phosphate uridylyltransferase
MFELQLCKPDGRALTLYGRQPLTAADISPLASMGPAESNPHLRWHPLRGEWVAYAPSRQQRTFLPPPLYDPLLPSNDTAVPTELPLGDYDIAVFDNLFASMHAGALAPPAQIVATAPANGSCEVVVFSQDRGRPLADLPLGHIELLLQVWARRTEVLSARPEIQYVLPFENRGAEVGVTLHHPHGQIYAYPFVPPVAQRMQTQELAFHESRGQALLEALIDSEIAAGARIIYQGELAVAFVPAWARYPYEVWIAPRKSVSTFTGLSDAQRSDLARALKATLRKYDGLWQIPLPYIMAWYQAPFDGTPRGAYHLHAECYPAYRMQGRLKYLAGTEVAAGMFVNDTLPEQKAEELRAVQIGPLR